ncbi:MAG: extracellular solute-binding protein [Clostridia bacterium]|nr:extracellular solute-binding protein [Clostridia bacterium]
MKKRILSLLLVLLMALSLVACAGGETPAETDAKTSSQSSVKDSAEDPSADSSVTEDSDLPSDSSVPSDSDLPEDGSDSDVSSEKPDGSDVIVDYGPSDFVPPEPPYGEMAGKEYTVIQHEVIGDPFGYGQDTREAQLVQDRIDEVQSKYGCSIYFTEMAYSDQFATEIQGLQFAESGGDLIFSTNNAQLRKTVGTGPSDSMMVDLLTVDDIINFWDFNKWGNITSRETMMSGGVFYGVTPALWYNRTPLPYYNLVYNKTLLEQFDLDDPQELWEQESWDRDAMLELVTSCYDEAGSVPVWGMTASMMHMVRAAYLSSGVSAVEIGKIYANGSVDWTHGMASDEAVESLQWLKNSLTAYAKYFNNGKANWANWSAHEPFLEGQTLFALTAPSVVLNHISVQHDNFGLITWAGVDANAMTGFYENCCSVSVPIFAQDAKHSAYLMYDLFKGLGEIETASDMVKHYRDTYFTSDLDVKFLLMNGAKLNYSYWPNGGDEALKRVSADLLTSSSLRTLVDKSVPVDTATVETYLVPNTVQLEIYRQNGLIP